MTSYFLVFQISEIYPYQYTCIDCTGYCHKGVVLVVNVWQLYLQLPIQSVPITTKVMRSNPAHDEVYSKQHYVVKYVSDLRQAGGFLRILRFPPPQTDRHDITKILLKVALNTKTYIVTFSIQLSKLGLFIHLFLVVSKYRGFHSFRLTIATDQIVYYKGRQK